MTLLVDMTVSMEVRTSATETVDSGSIAHQVKSKTIKIIAAQVLTSVYSKQ